MNDAAHTALSVFLPVYNETGGLVDSVMPILEALRGKNNPFELLLVNDGSTDGSDRICDELAEQNPEIRVLHLPHGGYGRALQAGFRASRGDIVFYTDSDGCVDPKCIIETFPLDLDVDLLAGYRIGKTQNYENFTRYLVSTVYNLILRLLFRIPCRDANYSFKFVRRHVLEKIRLDAESVFIDGQLLAEAMRAGARIREKGLLYRGRVTGQSKLMNLRAIVETLRDIIRYRWRGRCAV